MHQIRRLMVLPWPHIAKGCDAGGDQAREKPGDGGGLHTQCGRHGAAAGIEQNIGRGQQPAEIREAGLCLQFQHHRALAAIVVPEMQRPLGPRFIIEEGADMPGGRA